MTENQLFDWRQALSGTYESAVKLIVDNIPQLIGTVVVLIAGIFCAWLLRMLARKLTLAAETVILRSARHRGIAAGRGRSYSILIGNIVFWAVLIFFIATAANLLGWRVFYDTLQSLLAYLPSIFAGVFIILAGILLGRMARSLVESTARSANVSQPEFPALISQIAVNLTAVMIGIEQLGIDIGFLTTVITVIIGVAIAGLALAFALGAKQYVANLIAAQVCHRHYQPGDWIRLSDTEGYLIEVTQTALILDTARGRIVVPAGLLQQRISEIVLDREESSATGGSILGNLFRKQDGNNGAE